MLPIDSYSTSSARDWMRTPTPKQMGQRSYRMADPRGAYLARSIYISVRRCCRNDRRPPPPSWSVARGRTTSRISILRSHCHELVVVTGVSGSGKSSLVFDTLYAEGQRRYVETFSPYARQFLDRMDKPQVDSISGIPPAIAIDQTNPVRHFALNRRDDDRAQRSRKAALCSGCKSILPPLRPCCASRYAREHVCRHVASCAKGDDPRLLVCFPVPVPKNFKEAEVRELLQKAGLHALSGECPVPAANHERKAAFLEVIQDRVRLGNAERSRVLSLSKRRCASVRGRINIHVVGAGDPPERLGLRRYSSELHCAECDLSYREPVPSLFFIQFTAWAPARAAAASAVRWDRYGLVIPDESKSLRAGRNSPLADEVQCRMSAGLSEIRQEAPAFPSTDRGVSSAAQRFLGD